MLQVSIRLCGRAVRCHVATGATKSPRQRSIGRCLSHFTGGPKRTRKSVETDSCYLFCYLIRAALRELLDEIDVPKRDVQLRSTQSISRKQPLGIRNPLLYPSELRAQIVPQQHRILSRCWANSAEQPRCASHRKHSPSRRHALTLRDVGNKDPPTRFFRPLFRELDVTLGACETLVPHFLLKHRVRQAQGVPRRK